MQSGCAKTDQRDHNRPDESNEQNIINIKIMILDNDIGRRHPNNY